MLSSQQQRVWDDVPLFSAEEAEEPSWAGPDRTSGFTHDRGDPPLVVVAGVWITPTLVIFGAMTAALALGVGTALGWALWHHWPRLSGWWTSAPRRSGPRTVD